MFEPEPQSAGELIASVPIIDDGVSAAAGPYRLYKRRWVGVFAMVSTTFFFFMWS